MENKKDSQNQKERAEIAWAHNEDDDEEEEDENDDDDDDDEKSG